MASIDELLQKHSPKWHKAVSHPFLRSCADGTCPKEAFERWLASIGREQAVADGRQRR